MQFLQRVLQAGCVFRRVDNLLSALVHTVLVTVHQVNKRDQGIIVQQLGAGRLAQGIDRTDRLNIAADPDQFRRRSHGFRPAEYVCLTQRVIAFFLNLLYIQGACFSLVSDQRKADNQQHDQCHQQQQDQDILDPVPVHLREVHVSRA